MATPIKMFKDTEDKIATLKIQDGQLIFATDTQNIYLDDKDIRGVYNKAGNSSFVEYDEPDAESTDVWFVLDEPTVKIYGIKRKVTDNPSPQWQRIDDAENLKASAYITKEGEGNDFDTIYPWSAIKTCNVNPSTNEVTAWIGDDNFTFDGTNGEVMTYFPEFWIKREQVTEDDGVWEYIRIADKDQSGYIHVEPFMLGRYTMSGSANNVHSRNKQTSLVNVTIINLRDYAKHIGSNWGIIDWHHFIIQDLYLVEYANYNSQLMLGNGVSTGSSQIATGGCDSLLMKSGCVTNNSRSAVAYRGLENPLGNIHSWIDGINVTQRQIYVCEDPSKYVSDIYTDDYKKINYNLAVSSSSIISEVGYDENYPLIAIPKAVSSTATTSEYLCDTAASTADKVSICIGGSWMDNCGLFTLFGNNVSTSPRETRGSRLMFRNLKISNVSIENHEHRIDVGGPVATISANGVGPYTYEAINKNANFNNYLEMKDNEIVIKKELPQKELLFSADIKVTNGIGNIETHHYSQMINGLITDFTHGSDEQIKAMLDAHYEGTIDINDYWKVGDTRLIHLNAIDSPNTNAFKNKWVEQDITVVITAINHHDLKEKIGIRDKAAITVQTREVLNNVQGSNNVQGLVYLNFNSDYDLTFLKWSETPLRKWMNDQFLTTCFSTGMQDIIKETKHNRLIYHDQKETEEVIDKIFFPSCPEVFGNVAYTDYLKGAVPAGEEGTQWEYYKDKTHYYKYGNNNGVSNDIVCFWWESSPSSYAYDSTNGYRWCRVDNGVNGIGRGNFAYGFAPAFCL